MMFVLEVLKDVALTLLVAVGVVILIGVLWQWCKVLYDFVKFLLGYESD